MTGYPYELVGPPAPPPIAPRPETLSRARAARARQLQVEGLQRSEPRELPPWRLAGSLVVLGDELDAAFPARDKASDGTIADANHATTSDHYPWLHDAAGMGVVRARDIDSDGPDLAAAFERARQLVVAGRLPQLAGGGYLIFAGKITADDWSGWKRYTGPNPHVLHGHVSVSRNQPQYDDRRPWGLWAPAPAPAGPAPAPAPASGWTGPDLRGSGIDLRGDVGDNGPRVQTVQAFLRRYAPLYAGQLVVDGYWGPQTCGVLAEFARRTGIRGADGRNIGPQIARKLWVAGCRA